MFVASHTNGLGIYVNEMQRSINGLGHEQHAGIIPYGTWSPFDPGAMARAPNYSFPLAHQRYAALGAAQAQEKGFVGHLYDLFRSGTTDLRFQRDAACASGADGQSVDPTACTKLNTDYTAAVDQAIKRMKYTGIAIAVVAGVGTTALIVRRRHKKGGR